MSNEQRKPNDDKVVRFPSSYYDPEFCSRMASYCENIAETFHEDGFRDEYIRNKKASDWWKDRAAKLRSGEIT